MGHRCAFCSTGLHGDGLCPKCDRYRTQPYAVKCDDASCREHSLTVCKVDCCAEAPGHAGPHLNANGCRLDRTGLCACTGSYYCRMEKASVGPV